MVYTADLKSAAFGLEGSSPSPRTKIIGAIMTMEHWFSVPILFYDLNAEELESVQGEIEKVLPDIQNLDLTNPWSDTVRTSFKYTKGVCNLVDDLKLGNLKKVVLEKANEFCKNYNLDFNLNLKESWVNFSENGGFQFEHYHVPYLLSGVYYYQSDGDDGAIQFNSPNKWLDPNVYPFGYNNVTYQPIVGRLLLFPSYLEHLVNINKTNSTRISFSFNIEVLH